MEIILRNGETITLDWNLIVLEYLEQYKGGIKKLRNDIEDKSKRFSTFNFIIYCIISASSKEELSYEEIMSLININDYSKIIDFVITNINQIENNKYKNNNRKYNFKKHN